jgi:hypothetical protein
MVVRFVVGAVKTLVTDRSWLHSGMGMKIVGAIEAVIIYVSGAALRVAV